MRQRQTVVVDRSSEEVYEYLADPRNVPEWVDPVAEVEVLSRGQVGGESGSEPEPEAEPEFVGESQASRPGEVPVRFRQRVDAGGEPVGHEGALETDPDAWRVRYRFENRDGELSTTFELEPVEDRTRVVEELEVPLTSVWTKVLAPILYVANRGRLKRQLEDLKQALEAKRRR